MNQVPDAKVIKQIIIEMPKVELHLHLEGAITFEKLFDLIKESGKDSGVQTYSDLQNKLNYTDFTEFINTWKWKNSFITAEEDFEDIAYQVLKGLHRQNVRYVEAFYSPGDYRRQGLSVRGITEQLIKGKDRARHDFGIQCELIIDLCRDDGPSIGMQRLNDVMPFLGHGLIGIGIGGSEQNFPPEPYAEVYKEARRRGFRLTVHAGEAAGANSIWGAIEKLGTERIGHGTRAIEDEKLISLLRTKQIPLEMCITSNLKTQVCKSLEAHPFRDYFNRGLMLTVNSDDPEMFGTSITQEYLLLSEKLGFSLQEIKQLSMNGIEASFLPTEMKKVYRSKFEQEWKQLSDKYGLIL